MTSCFISYGRKDDEPFVKDLYKKLINKKIDVWWDREAMESRGISFLSVIDEAIRSVDRLLFVIGPSALKSDYVNHELSIARENCKIIIPVIRIGDYSDVPEEFNQQNIYNLCTDEVREFENLAKELLKNPPALAELFGKIPPKPGHLINRINSVDYIQKKILAEVNDPVAICGGIKATTITGMGGIGKTVLASLVANSCKIRREFSQGIIFIRLLPESTQIEIVNALRRILKDHISPGETIDIALNSLSKILARGRRLLILDNIWSVKQISDIVSKTQGTANRLLFTTRVKDITDDLNAQVFELDLLEQQQSIEFIADWLNKDSTDLPDLKYKIVERCGRLPLALSICGALLRSGTAWNVLADALKESEIYFLNREIPGYDYPGVFASMDVGYKALKVFDEEITTRFRQLVVFNPGIPIPEQVIFKLWESKSNADKRKARYQLNILANRTLITISAEGSVTIHDIIYTYLKNLGEDILGLRKKIINAFRLEEDLWSIIAENNLWLRDNLVDYLLSYKDFHEIDKLLCEESISGENTWYTMRSNLGEVDKYWDDLTKIYNNLEWEDVKTSISLATRIVMMKSSILSIDKNIPCNLIISAVKWGIWKQERALVQLKRIPQSAESVNALIKLLRYTNMDFHIIIDEIFLKLREINIKDFGISELIENLKEFSKNLFDKYIQYTQSKVYDLLLNSDDYLFCYFVDGFISLFKPEDYDRLLSIMESKNLSKTNYIYVRAILGQLLSEQVGLWNIQTLVGKATSNNELANIVSASIRQNKKSIINIYLAQIFIELNDKAKDYENGLVIKLFTQLSNDIIENLFPGIDEEKLVLRFNDSSIDNLRYLYKCAKHEKLHKLLFSVAEKISVSVYGTAGIASILYHTNDKNKDYYLKELIPRLRAEIEKSEIKSDWEWLGDVAYCFGSVLIYFPLAIREKLIKSVSKIYNTRMTADAIYGLSEGMNKEEIKIAIDILLSDLSYMSNSHNVIEPLNQVAPLLTLEQTKYSLSIAQASRDDGFETSCLFYLVKYLSPQAKKRIHKWIIEKEFEHLKVPKKQISNDWRVARSIKELIDTSISKDLLPQLEGLAFAIKDTYYAVPAIAKIAEAYSNNYSEELWLKVEQLLSQKYPKGQPGELLAILASIAKGQRQERYLALALEEENILKGNIDNDHSRCRILKELPASVEISGRSIELINKTIPKRRDGFIRDLIDKIEPKVLLNFVDRIYWYDEPDKSIKIVSHKLIEYGYTDKVLSIYGYSENSISIKEEDLDILYKYLSLEQVNRLIVDYPDNLDLIVRLAELNETNRALDLALKLNKGYERLNTVIRCCKNLRDNTLKEKYLLEVLPDLEYIDTPFKLYECIDKGCAEIIYLSESIRIKTFIIIASVLGQKIRLQSLPGLYVSSQLIYSLIGVKGVEDTFTIVEDICRWWPSYPRKQTSEIKN